MPLPAPESRRAGDRIQRRPECALDLRGVCAVSTGRALQPGDQALTDYDGRGRALVTIMERTDKEVSGSGICFRVHPPLRNCSAMAWIDADWFERVPEGSAHWKPTQWRDMNHVE